MTHFVEHPPFRPDRLGDASLLRGAFRRAAFEEKAVKEVLEGRNDRMIDIECALRRTAEATAFHSLVRLFILGCTTSEEAARRALLPANIEHLIECGLVVRAGEGVRAVAKLEPWRSFFLLSDSLPPEGESLPYDFVMRGTSPSSISLTRLTFRNRVKTTLDVGTGAGIHALLAAAHSEQVVATDTNPRALNFACMNARLNGIENISFRQGSFFEPVTTEKFDLIISNPPFIISPESSLMFQNPGMRDDAASELIVRESAAHLNEMGCAVSLISWCHEEGDDWSERPRRWVVSSDCDLWLLHATSETPLSYAANALRQIERIGSPAYAKELDRWLAYYRDRGIRRLMLGAAILRKRNSTRNWIHCEDLAGAPVATETGDQIQRVFAAEDFLNELTDDDGLLDCRLTLHPDHVIEQRLVAGEEGWVSQSLILVPAKGIEHRAALDPRVLLLLSQCNGTRTVREIISAIGQNDGTDLATAAAAGLPIVRRLLRAGFLIVDQQRGATRVSIEAAFGK